MNVKHIIKISTVATVHQSYPEAKKKKHKKFFRRYKKRIVVSFIFPLNLQSTNNVSVGEPHLC